MKHGSIETKHGSDEQNMDLVVPFEMEHGSQILKFGLFVIRLIGVAVVHSCQHFLCGSSFLNRPTCSSGVPSLVFPIVTLVAFGIQTPMQVTLLWTDPWPMSLAPMKGASGVTMDKKTCME